MIPAFQDVAARRGIGQCTSEFHSFRMFKLQWQYDNCRFGRLDCKVSDYLADAPYEVLEELAEAVISKAQGDADEVRYGPLVRAHVTDPGFARWHQAKYLRRSRSLTPDSKGFCKDLSESVGRLRDRGLWPDDDVAVVWNESMSILRAAECSVLLKVICVNDRLDAEDVEDDLLDWVVYTQAVRIRDLQANFPDDDVKPDYRPFGVKPSDMVRMLDRRCLRV